MLNLKMTLGMLLIAYLNLGSASCSKKLDLDIGIFSKKHQKFYFANEKKETKYEFGTFDPRADKLVCVPYDQYIDYTEKYTCKRNQ